MKCMNIALLESWFTEHQRPLPFRQSTSAYHIWISEVLLQQTQMDTVLNYYPKFIQAFPTVTQLAKASLESILTIVQGIGYYRRFRLLHAGANYIQNHHQGILPKTHSEWLAVPGVGSYTAGAIMAIAYNQPYSATDGNVIRVLSRFYGLDDDMRLPKSRAKIDQRHLKLVQQAHPKIYIQAVMELGALICRPVQPRCQACPLQKQCQAYKLNLVDQLPYMSALKKKKTRFFHTLVLVKNQKILLQKNQESLLNAMYLLPQWEGNISLLETWINQNQCTPKQTQLIGTFKHIFTHQRWIMETYRLNISQDHILTGIWIPFTELASYPIPEVHKKILRVMFPNLKKSL
jgi:A/G-specific adenine glycosylase